MSSSVVDKAAHVQSVPTMGAGQHLLEALMRHVSGSAYAQRGRARLPCQRLIGVAGVVVWQINRGGPQI